MKISLRIDVKTIQTHIEKKRKFLNLSLSFVLIMSLIFGKISASFHIHCPYWLYASCRAVAAYVRCAAA